MEDWKPKGISSVKGGYIDEYPNNPKDGHWWLLGTNEDGSAYYLDDRSQEIIHTRHQDGEFEELDTNTIPEGHSVSEYIDIKQMADERLWDTWSRYSWPFYTANGLRTTGRLLTRDQAVIYSFREIWDVPRQETAAVLNKSPNTVDNLLSNAKQKVQWAESLAKHVDDLRGFAPPFN